MVDVVDARAFHHPIKVRWADCDPANIAYTGRIPNFALEAIDAWWEHHFDAGWYGMNIDRNIGTPFVHLSLDFRAPVTPRHMLDCEVRVLRVGESSVRFAVRGSQNGTLCFDGEFVEVFVNAGEHQRKIPVPDTMRAKLEALRDATAGGQAGMAT